MKNSVTRKLVYGALMVALATVLSLFTLFKAPYGGSVTFGSMVPIVLFSLLFETRWGLLTAFAYSLLQMLLGFSAPPVQDFASFAAVVLLDYVIAFTVLGLAGAIARRFKNGIVGAGVGTVCVMAMRFACHFLSGIVIWDVYAPEGMPVWLYSLGYNGFYMLFEMLISVVVIMLLWKFLPVKKLTAVRS